MVKQSLSIAVVFFFLIVVMRLFNVSIPVSFQISNTYSTTEFSVIGHGKVTAVPNLAVIDAGITVDNESTSDNAKNKLATVNNAIISALRGMGIDEKDIETSSFSIYPTYASEIAPLKVLTVGSNSTATSESRITGYSGNAAVQVKVRKTSLSSKVVSALSAAGATNISGPRFELDKPEVYQEQARSAAISDAKRQAKQLEKELGIKLGKITNMMDSSSPEQYTYGRGMGATAMDLKTTATAPEPTFAEGTNTFTSYITLTFERK